MTISELREAGAAGRDGLTADALIRLGESLGLIGRGVSLDAEQLKDLPTGSILHWSFTHYVVLDRVKSNSIEVMDPALGRRGISLLEVRRHFTGVALIFEQGPSFEKGQRRRRSLPPLLLTLLLDREILPHVAAASAVAQCLTLLPALLTRTVIDSAVPLRSTELVIIVGLAAFVCLAYSFWVQSVRAALMVHLRTRIDSRLTHVFVAHLLGLPFEYFQTRSAGDLMVRLSSNSAIRELVSSGVLSLFLDGTMLIVYLGLLLWVAPLFAVVAGTVACLQILVALATARQRADLAASLLQAASHTSSYQLEVITGIESVKASGLERLASEHWLARFNSELNVSLDKGLLDAKVEAIGSTLRSVSPIAILIIGSLSVIDGSITLGELIANSAIATALLVPTSSLLANIGRFALLGTHVDRLTDVFEARREDAGTTIVAPPMAGKVSLERIAFRYAAEAPWVVKDVTTLVDAGEFVGIVGRSGSGKSTLARLVATLYRPTAGAVKFDGIDARTLEPSSLRRQLGIVTQNTHLFGLTIRDNITGSDPKITDDDVQRAAKIACVHEDIAALPMGYNTLLIDRGASLSGGQRQRLSIAKAVVRRPRILILDEATSHLDTVTEALVAKQLRQLDCTLILIAHRLSTVIDANRLLVLHEGQLVDAADHRTLIGRCAHYRELVEAQLGHLSKSHVISATLIDREVPPSAVDS